MLGNIANKWTDEGFISNKDDFLLLVLRQSVRMLMRDVLRVDNR